MARWRPTLRARVTAMATVVVVVVLTVAAVLVVGAQERALTNNVDEQLERTADDLGDALEAGERPAAVTGFGDDDAAFQVVAADGTVLAASDNVAGADPIAPATDDEVVRTIEGLPHDDGPFMVRSTAVALPDGVGTIHLAATLDDVEESVDALTASLLVGVPLAAAVLAVVLWVVVGRTLRPVEVLRAEVAAIGGSELDRRVAEPAGDDEVARLARTMNGMLGRIEEASARQQRFVADASHELRSPLARMRAELEVDLAHPGSASPAATHRSVLEEAVALQQLVEDLLHLARSDAGVHDRADIAPVELAGVVLRAAEDLRADGRLAVDTTGVEPGIVASGRREALARLVGNLLDNAGRHARSRVTVSLGRVGDAVELAVADDGPGVPAADAEWIFERFTRLDEARTAGAGGTGLGLAIARDIAESHGGTITVTGSRFVVRLPAC